MIQNQKIKIPVFPLLLTITELPESGKADVLAKALHLTGDIVNSQFSHFEFIASGFKQKKRIESAHVMEDHSFRFGMQAGLISNSKIMAINNEIENDSTFDDLTLRSHMVGLAKYLQERQIQNKVRQEQQQKKDVSTQTKFNVQQEQLQEKDLSSEVNVQQEQQQKKDFFTKTNVQQKQQQKKGRTRELEDSLNHHGIGFINVWDVSINDSIRPFVQMLGRYLTRNQMWLFVDLKDDLSELHLPVDDQQENSQRLQWRSRMQYLLRMCQMCEYTKSKDDFKQFCQFFAIDKRSHAGTVSVNTKMLRKEIQNAARQMGVEKLIEFEIKSLHYDQNKCNHELRPLRRKIYSTLHHLLPEDISLSWIFLRSSFMDHNTFYMTHEQLNKKAEECRIPLSEVSNFCEFFTSFGSILDISLIDKSSDYVVVKPSRFFARLKLFFQNAPARVTSERLIYIEDGEENVILQMLCSVGLALQHPQLSDPLAIPCTYYVPSIQTNDMNTSLTEGAIQLVLSTETPKMNLHIEITKRLLHKVQNTQLKLMDSRNANTVIISIVIESDISTNVVLTFQGDVTEISFTNFEKLNETRRKSLCSEIVAAINSMFEEKSEVFPESTIKYHFAIRCKNDVLDQPVAFNAYRKRHVLPNHTLCDDCKTSYADKMIIIKAWNSALEKVSISKSNGE